jgi:hypothetical protein
MAEGNQAVDQLISFTAVENSQNPSSIFNRPYKATLYYTRVLTCYTNNSQPSLETNANILLGPAPPAVVFYLWALILASTLVVFKQIVSVKLMLLIFPSLVP